MRSPPLSPAVDGGADKKELSHSDVTQSCSIEDNVQYLFYSMKLVNLLKESNLAASFQLANGMEKLFGDKLPEDCPVRQLLKMKQSLEEHEKEIGNESTSSNSSSTSSGSSSSREVSEDDDDEKSVEKMEEEGDVEEEDVRVKEQMNSLHGEVENLLPFSFKNNIPSSKSLQQASNLSIFSAEKELETVLHQLRQQRAASLEENTSHATSSKNIEDDRTAKTKASTFTPSGESEASRGYSSTTTEAKGDLLGSSSEEQTQPNRLFFSNEKLRQRNDKSRNTMHREEFQSTEKNVSMEEKKNGDRVQKIGVVSACFSPAAHPTNEVVQEEDIQLCEEDMRTLEQIENEVAREMSRLAIIRRHR